MPKIREFNTEERGHIFDLKGQIYSNHNIALGVHSKTVAKLFLKKKKF